ncbi:MAG: PrsW family glutamic-type intramembrane protease [Cytophagales bacterium]
MSFDHSGVLLINILLILYSLVVCYVLFHKNYHQFLSSQFVVLSFAVVSICSVVKLSTIYAKPYVEHTDSLRTIKEYRYVSHFNSDTLDKYFLDVSKHESFILNDIYKIEPNDLYDYINYYEDKTNVNYELKYRDVAYWALALIHLYEDSEKSWAYLQMISNKDFYKINYYKGVFLYDRSNFESAESYFSKAYTNHETMDDEFLNMYFYCTLKNNHLSDSKLLHSKHAERINPQTLNFYYLKSFNIFSYVNQELSNYINQIEVIHFLASFFICIVWCFFLFSSNIFKVVKFHNSLIAFGLELYLVFLCLFVYNQFEYNFGWTIYSLKNSWHLFGYSVGVIGLTEEFVKFLPILVILSLNKFKLDSFEIVFYASLSALAFAFIENNTYFQNYENTVVNYYGRAVFSTISHMFNSSLLAFGIVMAQKKSKIAVKVLYIFLFFLASIFSHGIYDFLLFTNHHLIFYVGYFMSIVVWVVILNNSLNLSHKFTYLFKDNFKRNQIVLGIGLVSVLVIEYLVNVYKEGYVFANSHILGGIIIYGIVVSFFITRLSKYDLVNGYIRKLTFVKPTISNEVKIPLINVIYFLENFFTFNSINPRNYVGKQIVIFKKNQSGFKELIPMYSAQIIDRLVVLNTINSKKFEETHWFMIQNHNAYNDQDRFIMFRFLYPFDTLDKTKPKSIMLYKAKTLVSLESSVKDINEFELIGEAYIIQK